MIDKFEGEYRFLSNFSPSWVIFEDLSYPTVEHAYQAAKTEDLYDRLRILNAETPALAKKMGRKVEIRPDWENIKLKVMYQLVEQKFSIHPELRDKLLETGNQELIEGNWWGDKIWGVCRGEGKNYLGKILMAVRTRLQRVMASGLVTDIWSIGTDLSK